MSPRRARSGPHDLVALLRRRAVESADRDLTFLADGESPAERLTFAGLDARARAIAAGLAGHGAAGERALLLYPAGLDLVAAFFGGLYASAVVVPAYPPRPRRPDPRLHGIVESCRPRLVLTDQRTLERREELVAKAPALAGASWIATDALPGDAGGDFEPRPAGAEAVAMLQYTSGSTGVARGVTVTHGNLLHNQEMIRRAFGQSADSVIVGWLPLYHDMGLIGNVLQPLYVGARCVLMPPAAFLQQPVRWLRAISRFRATTSGGPDFAYDLCVRRIPPEQRAELDLSSWEVAFSGAEPVRAETLDRFAAAFAGCGFRRTAFFPCYGLAEATLFVAGGEAGGGARTVELDAAALERGEAVTGGAGCRRLVSCGRTALDQRLAIVDPASGSPLPAGRVGEIWVAGASVAAGYWGRPEESEELFRAPLPGHRETYLRTGDLGSVVDGELVVTGRLKDLIIVRGRNLYPQDLEVTALEACPDLRPAASAAFGVTVAGEERIVLVAEIDRRPRRSTDEVAADVRQAVAEEHQVAVHDVVLIRAGTLPKTSSGKVRRRATHDAYLAGELAVVASSRAAPARPGPETPAEPTVAASPLAASPPLRRQQIERLLIEEVVHATGLPAAAIDRDRPLAGAGVDSLRAIELQQRVERALGVELAIVDLLADTSLAELATRLADAVAAPTAPPPTPRDEEEHPLTDGQRGLWLDDRLAPEEATYNLAAALRGDPGLDLAALRRALESLTRRHPVLRSTFREIDGEPWQRVHPSLALDFAVEEAPGGDLAELLGRLRAEAFRPLELAAAPPLRVRAWVVADGAPLVLLVIHHLVADLWSVGVLARELGELYTAESGGAPARLAPLPLSYAAWAGRQRERLEGAAGDRLWDYWRQRLSGELPLLDLPVDRPRRPAAGRRAGIRHRWLEPRLAAALRALAARHDTTLFAVLLAAFQGLLHRYTRQEDLVVGAPFADRDEPGVGGLVGYLVSPLVLRGRVAGESSFEQVVEGARETLLGALAHGGYPLPLLSERLGSAGEGRPLLQVLLVMLQTEALGVPGLAGMALGAGGERLDLGRLGLTSLELGERRTSSDLSLVAATVGDRLGVAFEFPTSLFDASTIERMLGHFENLVEEAAARPSTPLTALALLGAAEREQVLVEWALGAEPTAPPRRLDELFADQVARTPDAPALLQGDLVWSYRELAARVADLAARLQELGVGPEARVGVFVDRRPELVVALLGVLAAGAAYVPLDPAYPPDRLEWMARDAGSAAVVTCGDLVAALPALGAEAVLVGAAAPAAARRPAASRALPESLAYLIFTSGSTGRPKAVAITHASAVTMVRWAVAAFTPEELARTLFATSISFDLSVFELFAPLACGGSVVLVRDSLELPRAAASAPTLVNTVPSVMAELLAAGGLPASVRAVALAGEALPRALVDQLQALPQVRRVLNLYGPAEDTTYSTAAVVPRGSARPPAIGRPIDGTRAYLLDARGTPVPAGLPGELLLGGAGLARGYLGRPGLTAERFVPDPWSGVAGARLYRTGDLARWRADGELEYLGRFDHQVKVRGVRIELGEIEAVLAAHRAVHAAAVLALPGPAGLRLVAYLAAPESPAELVRELREEARRRLPEAMVPAAWLVLAALPLTPSGKIDRRALAALTPGGGDPERRFEAPRGGFEEALAALWSALLGGGVAVGRGDRFFDLGGHSLLAMRLAARIRDVFAVELPLAELFAAPTLAELAARVEAARGAPRLAALPLARRRGARPAPLSFGQQRLWFLDRLAPGSAAYNVGVEVRLDGALSPPALVAALREIHRRHAVLRTVFPMRDGEPVQVVAPPTPLQVPTVDLSALARAEAEAARLVRAAARRPFDLEHGPLLRVRLLRLGDRRHRLAVAAHHVVADGWSVGIVLDELVALYAACREGRGSPLAEPAVQYADFAAWQREALAGAAGAALVAYWRQRLAGADAELALPVDRPRSGLRGERGGRRRGELPAELAAALDALARREGATPFMVLAAVFAALLARLSGQRDLCLGTPFANRGRSELAGLIGFFVNTLVLRVELEPAADFRALLGRVRQTAVEAYAHQELPFERLVEVLQPERQLGRQPLFQVLFAHQGFSPSSATLPDLAVTPREVDPGVARFDLSLFATPGEEGVACSLLYAADLFDATTAERLLRGFATLAREVADHPGRPLESLPLLAAAERHQALHEWGVGGALGELRPVHESFAGWARRTPEVLALRAGDATCTYGELARRAAGLTARLVAAGVGPEAPVALCVGRSSDAVVAILAVLGAGGCYVPLDPSLPAERLAVMLEDARPALAVVDAQVWVGLPADLPRLAVDAPAGEPAAAARRPGRAHPSQAAYVLFTSGSTGRPKGVVVEHRNLASYTSAVVARLGLPPGAAWASVSTLAADLGNTAVFGALSSGGTLHLVPEERIADAEAMAAWFEESPPDCLKIVPSHLDALLRPEGEAQPLPRRLLVLGGEAASWGLVDRVRRRAPGLAVVNHYGPTETTVGVLTHAVPAAAPVHGGTVPLGRPLAGARVQVADRGLLPAPVGVAGELLIGGAGVSRGYLGRPALTAERFVPDATGGSAGGRLYRTGDRARRRGDGTIELLGRLDRQVKVRGVRIEPAEVEAELMRCAGVRQAVVEARGEGDHRRLVAWVAGDGGDVDSAALRRELLRRLPEVMVPSSVVALPELPRTANGKVDRAALPDPDPASLRAEGGRPATSPVELAVARIWADVLGIGSRVGLDDDFFALGGHSLLATRMVSRVRAELAAELPLASLFERPTLAAFAAEVGRLRLATAGVPEPELSRGPAEGSPLSFSQERLWLLCQLPHVAAAYHLAYFAALDGPLSVLALEAALAAAVRRQRELGAAFPAIAGQPVRTFPPRPPVELPVVDLTGLDEAEARREGDRLARRQSRRPFDLARGPLWRAALVRRDGSRHDLLLALHHIVSDAWSRGVLLTEVAAGYQAAAAGRPSSLPDPPVDFCDVARWQRARWSDEALAPQLEAWRRRLGGGGDGDLELPWDRPRPARRRFRGGRVGWRPPAGAEARLRALSADAGATPFIGWLALFQALLHRDTGARRVRVGTPVAGRTRPEMEGLVGFLANTLVLDTPILDADLGAPTFAGLLDRARQVALDAFTCADLPFEKLVEALAPVRDPSRTPLFQVALALQNAPLPEMRLGDVRLRPLAADDGTAKFDLTLALEQWPGGTAGWLEYDADRFDRTTIERLGRRLSALLDAALEAPDRPLAELPLLAAAERHQALAEWNDVPRPAAAAAPVHRLVAARAAGQPDRVAVVAADGALSYGELAARASRLARRLAGAGVGAESRVGVLMEPGVARVVAWLAVLQAGAAYLPLDPAHPEERLAFTLRDAGAALLLCDRDTARRLPAGLPVPVADAATWSTAAAGEAAAGAAGGPAAEPSPEALAYVIYTSGSTGRPKGTLLTHRGLSGLVAWHLAAYGLEPEDRVTQLASAAFDAAVWEAWPALAAGASLHLVERQVAAEPAALGRWLGERRITVCFAPTPLAEALLAEGPPPGALRALLTGGDRLRRRPPADLPFPLVNHYGPTESAVVATADTIAPGPVDEAPAIGRPIAGTRGYVVDGSGHPVPPGVPGELWLGGGGLARGYLGRPGLTAERFVPDPFGGRAGARLYRTGDRVRHAADGSLAFLGRGDQQVQVRGVRVEPGEVEAVLAEHPAVAACAVVAVEASGGARLVAFHQPRPAAAETIGLRRYLAARLPAPMVPSAFVKLDRLPLTDNGKLDRKALTAHAHAVAGAAAVAGSPPPSTPLAAAVARLWGEVLGVEGVGAGDDFFALGGHSLLAPRLLARVREELGVEVPLASLFEAPTVAAMADEVERRSAAVGDEPGFEPAAGAEAPLSAGQERLWFLQRLEPASFAYNVAFALGWEGRLRPELLAATLDLLERRHEGLRTTFRPTTGEPIARVAAPVPRPLRQVDLSALPAAIARPAAERIAERLAARPFDLDRGPLLRRLLLRLDPAEHLLVLIAHHAVCDGASAAILVDELAGVYGALDAGRTPALPAVGTTVAAYAGWQRRRLAGGALAGELAYWRHRLSPLPEPLELPADRRRQRSSRGPAGRRSRSLPPAVAEDARALGRAAGASLFMVLAAAFQALLGRYAGRREVTVGTPVEGRVRPQLAGVVGFLVNTLVLRLDLAGDPDFRELVERSRQVCLGALAHQELPFERLVEELRPQRDLGQTPLFQVLFLLQSAPRPAVLPELTIVPRAVAAEEAKLDLTVAVVEAAGGLTLVAEYRADRFEAATAERLLAQLSTLLQAALAEPAQRLSRLPLLDAAERAQLLGEWAGGPAVPGPELCLHEMVAAQAARTPHAEAVAGAAGTLTYRELVASAAALASRLRRLGVGPEVPVAVCARRTPELVVALLAVLEAGGLYVPLDPDYPPQRLAFILADSAASVVVAPPDLAAALPDHEAPVVWVSPPPAPAAASATAPAALPDNLAYLIYTSGSTGRPKGVAIAHRSAAAFLHWALGEFAPQELAGCYAATSICFDLSVFELFAPLVAGGTVILGDDALALARLPEELAGRVRLLNTVPSALNELARLGAVPPGVRTVNLAGEPLRRSLADRVHALGVDRLLNLYGPSESTTYSTWTEVPAASAAEPTIGRPVAGTRAYVVDAGGGLQPLGVPGELWLAGAGLARGYLGRPGLTAERFVPDPYGRPGTRAYRTGDLARFRSDGDLEFLGRLDHQVKVRGFRVELGEVETVLASLPQIAGCAAAVREDAGGDSFLAAWVVPAPGVALDPAALRADLRSRLPEAMVPSVFAVLEALPLTPNGKLDRAALPPLAAAAAAAGEPPRGPVEEILAGLWAELLGVVGARRHDDFFALGGHSLLATRLAARLADAFAVEVPLRRLFEAPTLAGMAATVSGGGELAPWPRVAGEEDLPLSFAQERLWLLDRLDPGTAAYNMPCAVALAGHLEVRALARALDEVARRHETLRAVFRATASGPRQSIAPPRRVRLPRVDLAALAPRRRPAEAERLAARTQAEPFDLARGPLFRVVLVRLAPAEHRLLLNVHHVASDGWSMGVLLRELTALYRAAAEGSPSPLPPLRARYVELAAWQREAAGGERFVAELAYWRRQLAAPLPVLDLPLDRPRPAEPRYRGARVSRSLPQELTRHVESLSRRHGATPFMTLLAAFAVPLSRQSGQRDLVIGTPIAGRGRPEAEGLVGVCLNMLALRLDLAGSPGFGGFLRRVRAVTLDAYGHQDVPFEHVLAAVQPERDLGRTSAFQVLFNLLDLDLEPAGVELPGCRLELLSTPLTPSKFDLTLYARRRGAELALDLVYNADLFGGERMADLLEQVTLVLAQAGEDAERPIDRMSLLGETAAAALPDPAQPLTAGAGDSVLAAFRRQARRVPERHAAVDASGAWTYAELAAAADLLARHLRGAGIGRGDVVAIQGHRSAALVAALLGVLEAGAAFTVLDPAHPPARLLAAVRQARPAAWLGIAAAGPPPAELAAGLAEIGCVACPAVPSTPAAFAGLPPTPQGDVEPVEVGPDDLAYVAFTSGSTGAPKGILGTHWPLGHFVDWHVRTFGLDEDDRFSMLSGLSHDPLLRDVFTPLSLGATLCVPDPEEMASGRGLAGWLRREGIGVVHLTPGMGQLLALAGAADASLPELRRAFFGGDVLTRSDVAALVRLAPRATVASFYGATETPQAMGWQVVDAAAAGPERVPLGRGIDGVQLLVLDAAGGLAGIGEVGEIHVRTPHLTRGYLGDEALTDERYLADPWSAGGVVRLYRTGDRGRFRPDGSVDLVGRADGQVKLRGWRVELGEIEAALRAHPAVAAAAATVRPDAAGGGLVGYVVPAAGAAPSAAELRRHLRRLLAEPMVPGAFAVLDALPLTPNGKLDRAVLPDPAALPDLAALPAPAADPAAGAGPATAAAPDEAVEVVVRQHLAELLQRPEVDPQASFFELGGHSLLAAQLTFRLEQAFGIVLPLREMLAAPTAAGIAATVAARRAAAADDDAVAAAPPSPAPLVPAPADRFRPFPLTDIQQAYWIGRAGVIDRAGVASHRYLEIEGELDLERLEAAWRRVVERHDMLRAVVLPDGRQQVLEQVPDYTIEVEDLRHGGEAAARERLAALRERMGQQLLATDRWPLFEIRACRLPWGGARLFLSFDYLLADAWSFQVLLREVVALYERPSAVLEPLELTFRDYVVAQLALRGSPGYERARDYWRRRVEDLPPGPDLPLAGDLARLESRRFVRRSDRLEAADWQRLGQRGARRGLTPAGLLLAAFAEVLAGWSRNPRFSLVLTLFGRLPLHPQVNELVGDFTSTTLLAVDRRPAESFERRAQRLQERLWSDLDHRQFSGVEVAREMARRRGTARAASPVVFTSTLDLGSADRRRSLVSLPGAVVHSVSQTPQVLLDHQVTERDGRLEFNWDAVEEAFPPRLLDDMFAAYTGLLRRLAADEASWRRPLPGLAPPAHLAAHGRANDTAGPLPEGLLQDGFERRAAEAPDAVAVRCDGRTLTYREIDRRAARLARRLCTAGARPESLVAVVMEKGWEQVVAVLAVLRAGAAYLPIDPAVPPERLASLLRRGEARLALTQPPLLERLAWPAGTEPIAVEATLDAEGALDAGAGDGGRDPGRLAYVLFTSGSTGEPKGVMIDHRGALNTVVDVNQRFAVGPRDRVLALSALGFDLSVYDVFGLLAAGGALVMPEPAAARDPQRWAGWLDREGVTVWNSVPALLEMLVEYLEGTGGTLPPTLRLILLSGDWIPLTLPDRVRALARQPIEVISLGGATEASIWSILHPVTEVRPEWRSVPYGRPMRNQSFHVFDRELSPCPTWVPGELYIGGVGLARGYWRDPRRTAERFVVHPSSGERLYRTGDLGRWLPDGEIEFLGREDFQVKVQGHRIELGEIEAALGAHPRVRASAVEAVGPPRGPKRLVAYVVLERRPEAPAEPGSDGRSDPLAALQLKLRQPGLREVPGSSSISLDPPAPGGDPRRLYEQRRSHRSFGPQPVRLGRLSALLGTLAQVELPDRPLPGYRFPSAGGLYPVQTYVHVKEGRVEGVPGGFYYYHPRDHRLVALTVGGGLSREAHSPVNRAAFDACAFSLFLVADLDAIAPVYGDSARDFCVLEAGYMGQLLMQSAAAEGLGLCPIGRLAAEPVAAGCALGDRHLLVHSLIGGAVDGVVAPVAVRVPVDPAAELREHLAAKLPASMVPSTFVLLPALPLTANGKVDRRALPPPAPEAAGERDEPAPASRVESLVSGAWREVLDVEAVGRHDNFFELGGNSVTLVQVYHRLRRDLRREFPLVSLFEHPTVAGLAHHLGEAPGEAEGQTVERGHERAEKRLEARRAGRRRPSRGGEGGGDG